MSELSEIKHDIIDKYGLQQNNSNQAIDKIQENSYYCGDIVHLKLKNDGWLLLSFDNLHYLEELILGLYSKKILYKAVKEG